jgi:hypothetical protein
MIRYRLYLFCFLILGCGGTEHQKPKEVIIVDTLVVDHSIDPQLNEPVIPKGAVTANFNADAVPFYAFVQKTDTLVGVTSIAFQKADVPSIAIHDAYGAKLSYLRFPEFDQDLLLITAKIKDTSFNKYYLYQYRNDSWQLVVNRFAIHKNHVTDSLQPIIVDPSNSNNMLRYYSVFDLDKKSKLGYTWRLLKESIPILKE